MITKIIVVQSGSASFAGQGSYTTITIPIPLPNTNYRVTITPTADPTYIGNFYISNKTTNSFRITNTGSGTGTFDWEIVF